MKCPYCSDSIHPNAKFCPKCGLPVKEDATVMGGAYLTDDTGFNPWVIGGGALGLVLIALSIGWVTNRGGQKPQTVRTVSPPAYSTTQPGALTGFSTNPAFSGYSTTAQPARPAATRNPQVRWAWTPPPASAQPAWRPPAIPAPDPEPPSHMAAMPALMRTPEPTRVAVLQPLVPDVPALPANVGRAPWPPLDALPIPGALPASIGFPAFGMAASAPTEPTALFGAPAMAAGAPAADAPPGVRAASPEADIRADWVYDPVHERWALRTDRTRRTRATGVGRGGPVGQ